MMIESKSQKKPSEVLTLLFQHILEIDTLKRELNHDLPIDSKEYSKINQSLIKRAVTVNELLVEFDTLFTYNPDKPTHEG